MSKGDIGLSLNAVERRHDYARPAFGSASLFVGSSVRAAT
jgi:hypothetical protein